MLNDRYGTGVRLYVGKDRSVGGVVVVVCVGADPHWTIFNL